MEVPQGASPRRFGFVALLAKVTYIACGARRAEHLTHFQRILEYSPPPHVQAFGKIPA